MFLAAALLLSQTLSDYGKKGRDIAFDCKVRSTNNAVTEAAALDYLSCVSYLQGFTEGAYFCVPVGVTAFDLAAVVVKYGDDHPERLYLERGAFVKEVIDNAYPCKR